MKPKISLAFCLFFVLISCRKNDEILYIPLTDATFIGVPPSYLDQWTGDYEGNSHHWVTVPSSDLTSLVTTHTYRQVAVHVERSSLDSCLNFTVTYTGLNTEHRNDLKFTTSGHHSSYWGNGSGSGYLSVNVDSDSLQYNLSQHCGMPCQSGIAFNIAKN